MPCLGKFVGRSLCYDSENGEVLVNRDSLSPNFTCISGIGCDNFLLRVCKTRLGAQVTWQRWSVAKRDVSCSLYLVAAAIHFCLTFD